MKHVIGNNKDFLDVLKKAKPNETIIWDEVDLILPKKKDKIK